MTRGASTGTGNSKLKTTGTTLDNMFYTELKQKQEKQRLNIKDNYNNIGQLSFGISANALK